MKCLLEQYEPLCKMEEEEKEQHQKQVKQEEKEEQQQQEKIHAGLLHVELSP